MKVLQMNLISLLKPHQFTDVTVLAIPSLNFLTIIRFRTHVIPLAQLAKLINHHITFIRVMHTHYMILLKCNIGKAKGNYHIAPYFFFQYPHQTNALTQQIYYNAIPSILLN